MINIRMNLCSYKLVILGFSGLYIFAKDGVIENTQPLFGDSYLFSAITIIGLISIPINYFPRSVYKAELQLTKERINRITES
jgi:hypothetical protein